MRSKSNVLTVLAVFLLAATTVQTVGAVGTPRECVVVAYTPDYAANHYSLVMNASVLIGDDLIVDGNCPFTLVVNDGPTFQSEGDTLVVPLPEGTDRISIIVDNLTTHYTGLQVFPPASVAYADAIITDPVTVSASSIVADELMAHGITAAILFFMSTSVVYRVARYRVDRSFEVVV